MNIDKDDIRLQDPLKLSGIIDSYEYVLRKLVEEGLPKFGVYDRCADLVEEYKELVLKNNILSKNAQSLFELQKLEEKKVEEVKKIFTEDELNDTLEVISNLRNIINEKRNNLNNISKNNDEKIYKILSKNKIVESEINENIRMNKLKFAYFHF